MSGEDSLRDLSSVTRASVDIRLKVRGKEVLVTEITMGNMAGFIRACSPFLAAFDSLAEVKEVTAAVDDVPAQKKLGDKHGFFKMIAEHNNAFLDAAGLVCEVDHDAGARDFLARLRPDEFFHIALAVVEVNGDFFILRLAPALMAFLNGVGRIGMAPFNASLLPDMTSDFSPPTRTLNS